VLVLDQGMLVESGEPHDLLQHSSGIFTSMVAQTGPSSSTHLREVARMASVTRVASRSAMQLHLQQQLRMTSDVLGRRYVDNPVSEQPGSLQQQHQQGGQWEEGRFGGGGSYGRTGSEVSRYGFQVRQIHCPALHLTCSCHQHLYLARLCLCGNGLHVA
jgi:hypothetical protein